MSVPDNKQSLNYRDAGVDIDAGSELIERIKEIDLSDGKMDGKARRSVMECPHCNRTISMRYQRCIYCGEFVEHDPFAV